MNYTEQQIEEWKSKAEKWDALDEEISTFYPELEDDEESPFGAPEFMGDDEGLIGIGEAAARAFGYL